MKLLEYKNIFGSLEYDYKGKIYFGILQSVKGSFLYHGDTIEEVKYNFKGTVNLYLDYCKEIKERPKQIMKMEDL